MITSWNESLPTEFNWKLSSLVYPKRQEPARLTYRQRDFGRPKNFRWFPRATTPKIAKVLQAGSEKAEGTAEKPKLFTLQNCRNGLALMDLGQPSDRLLHDRLIDLVNRVNLANPLEHRQGQAATQMLAKFLKAFEYGIGC